MFKKILIGTDFSKSSSAALIAGLELAKKCLAKVVVVHVVSALETNYAPQPLPLQGTEWGSYIEKRFEEFFATSLYPKSQKLILSGHSASGEILKCARTEQCDLIVIGTHGHGAVARALMGSVAQKVTRESEIPVMVVREGVSQRHPAYEKILVPTDFSDTSMKALDIAVRFANLSEADLHVIHVVDWPTITLLTTGYPGYPTLQVSQPHPEEWKVDKTLHEMLKRKELVGDIRTKTVIGDPVDEILLYASKEKIDFIVMGTHGRRGLERVLLGSTTSAVIAKSEIPVMTISYPL
jgi:nucleotide-binding universal stress UspA family protein